jgi:hypothetical protein
MLLHEEIIDLEIMQDPDQIEAMEAAKRLISYETGSLDLIERLLEIAESPVARPWARVCAVYAIGYVDDDAVSAMRLENLKSDPTVDDEIIDYIEEALDNMCAPSVMILEAGRVIDFIDDTDLYP